MKLPTIRGTIERRILANFRVEPAVLSKVLPSPFEPKLAHGWGLAGICLIRLGGIRPRFVPRFLGISSENAAHRIAVEWNTKSGKQNGVYIPRRDTSSGLNVFAGGRVFPGEHHLSKFEVRESETEFFVSLHNPDVSMLVEASITDTFPLGSVFASLEEASNFFELGSLGYSATSRAGEFDGLELRSFTWQVEPLEVSRIESSFFADSSKFPPSSVQFDCALLMRGIEHEWHSREKVCCEPKSFAA